MLRWDMLWQRWPMIRWLVALILLALLLLCPQTLHAQEAEIVGAHHQTGWQANYWNNMNLEGVPNVVRHESVLSHDWGNGSPHPAIGVDHFSARWICTTYTPPGRYRFVATSDDGIRVYLDDELLIDRWNDHAEHVDSIERYLPGHHHTIRVDYYENDGVAVARLDWYRVGEHDHDWPHENEWRGEYYDNRYLSGSPALVRGDNEIDFNWGGGSPDWRIDDDNFSVRWTRTLNFSDDTYRFVVYSDDGVRLYIDGDRKIDAWYDMAVTRHTHTLHLSGGSHTIQLEYYEHRGTAQVELYWTREREPERPVGNLITCAPPQPDNYAWIKIYRRDGDGWVTMTPKGIGAICATGYLKIDGLPVDIARYGGSGHPYCVELWVDGQLAESVGNMDRGEAEFRLYAYQDNYTPWQCSPP